MDSQGLITSLDSFFRWLFTGFSHTFQGLDLWLSHFVSTNPAYFLLLPEITLAILGCLLFLLMAVLPEKRSRILIPLIGYAAQIFSVVMTYYMMYTTSRYFSYALGQYWGGLETIDPFSLFWSQMIDWVTIIVILLSFRYAAVQKYRGEYFGLLTIAGVSLMFMVASSDVMSIYLMTEFSSIVLYVLVGFVRGNRRSNEALLKFFLIGSFSGILILFGAALLYGLTGSTNLYDMKYIFSAFRLYDPVAAVALTMIAAGMGFKLAVAPFHTWAPDTYEGAPTPVTAFISVAPKAAAVCVWIRFFLLGLAPLKLHWVVLVAVISAVTLVVGNLGALHQFNMKRLLAYSGISHMGYILMGICAAALQPLERTGVTLESDTQGFYAVTFYMLTYLFFNLGAFAVVSLLETRGISPDMREYRGLGRRSPFLASMMTLFMLALAGLPPTSGFVAKLVIFRAALLNPALLWLVIVAGVLTIVALYYYLKVVYYMWLVPPDEGAEPLPNIPLSDPQSIALLLTTGAVLLMFVMPGVFYEFANKSSFLNYKY